MEPEHEEGEDSRDDVVSSLHHEQPHSEKPASTEASADGAEEREAQPPPAKRRLSSCPDSNDERSSCDSDVEILTPQASSTNAHTELSTRWALRNFSAWKSKRDAQYPTEKEKQVPSDILTSGNTNLLNKWLALYASETRKQDGGMYSPKTIYLLLAGLLRHMRSLNPSCPNFLHPSNQTFKPLHDSLVNVLHEIQTSDAVTEARSAEPFSAEEEERLWDLGVLSTHTPKGLLRAVYYLNAKNFRIFGANAHRTLKLSQIKRQLSPQRYVYTPSATDLGTEQSGVMLMMKKKNKDTIVVNSSVEKGNRCHVRVLDVYLQKIPPEAFERDVFYLQPIKHFDYPPEGVRWFTTQPVGKNSLGAMVREMCADAGIEGARTVPRKPRSRQNVIYEGEPSTSSMQFSFKLCPRLPELSELHHSTSLRKMVQTVATHIATPGPTVSTSQKQPQNSNTPQLSATPTTPSGQPSVMQSSPDQATGSSDVGNTTPEHLRDNQPLLCQQQQAQAPVQSPTPSLVDVGSSVHPPPRQDQREASVQTHTTTSTQTPPPLLQSPQNELPGPHNTGSHATTNHPQSPHSTSNASTHIQCPNPLLAIPQQLSFTNCHVVIYVTPSNIDITSTPQ